MNAEKHCLVVSLTGSGTLPVTKSLQQVRKQLSAALGPLTSLDGMPVGFFPLPAFLYSLGSTQCFRKEPHPNPKGAPCWRKHRNEATEPSDYFCFFEMES
jgi:hypothetical protein